MERIITNLMIGDFENYLRSDEKSENTFAEYINSFPRFGFEFGVDKAHGNFSYVGSHSCGPDLPDEYEIPKQFKNTFTFTF